MFDNILNWKLLAGSHEFPGPDGGTCINEAAVVAAGYKYKSIKSVSDCPPCFSRVIASYSIALNDVMPGDLRQELLMPFVTRLAGTADRYTIEAERIKHIVCSVVRRILPIALNKVGLHGQAERCAFVMFPRECASVADEAYYILAHTIITPPPGYVKQLYGYEIDAVYVKQLYEDKIDAARNCAEFARRAIIDIPHIEEACSHAASCISYALRVTSYRDREVYVRAVAILDEAIRLGNQATPVEVALVSSRMEAAKRVVEHA